MNTIALDEQERNHEFARRINRETRADPTSPYADKFLGIAGEKVVVVADSLTDVNAQLDAQGFDSANSLWLEASADYDSPLTFWNVTLKPGKGD